MEITKIERWCKWWSEFRTQGGTNTLKIRLVTEKIKERLWNLLNIIHAIGIKASKHNKDIAS